MVCVIVEYMMGDLRDFRRGTAQLISQQFYDEHPDTFSIRISGQTLYNGVDTLRQQLYDALNFRKASSKRHRLPSSVDLDEIDKEGLSYSKHNEQDEYGCVEYLPGLPSTETTQTQEDKKLNLIELWESEVEVNNTIKSLMIDTYFLQRQQLHKESDIKKFIIEWPYLNNYQIFINHANKLLGQPCETIWVESLETLTHAILLYFKTAEIVKEYDSRNKKNKIPDPETNHVRHSIKKARVLYNFKERQSAARNCIRIDNKIYERGY